MRSQMPQAGWAIAVCLLWNGCTQLAQESRLAPVAGTGSKEPRQVQMARRRAGVRPAPTPTSTARPATAAAASDVVQADAGRARVQPPASQREGIQQAGGLMPARSRSTPPLDPAAAAVIEQELGDTEPAERQGILADLEGLSPANMRAVLRAWKQSRQRRPGTEQLASGPQVNGPYTPPAPVAGEPESTTSRLRRSLSAGLGSVSAWGTAIVGGRRVEPVAVPPVDAQPVAGAPPAASPPRGQIEAITPPGAESRSLPGGEDVAATPPAVEASPTVNNPLQQLINLTEAEVADLPSGPGQDEREEFLSRHVALRMLYRVGGRHELALQAIPEIDPEEQEFWQHLFWGLANYFDTESLPGTDERAAEAAAQLTQAVLKLQRRAALEIKFAALCDQIEGYGVFESRSATTVSPGETVLLYAELANVSSVEEGSGQYLASHANLIEIVPQGGETDHVIGIELPVTEDRCRRQRRDYFASYAFELPRELAPGPHVLRLTVVDRGTRRRAQYSLNFLVGESPAQRDEPTFDDGPQRPEEVPQVTERRLRPAPAGASASSGRDRQGDQAAAASQAAEETVGEWVEETAEVADAKEEDSLPRATMSARAPDREEDEVEPQDERLLRLESRISAEPAEIEPSAFEGEVLDEEDLDLVNEPQAAEPEQEPIRLPDLSLDEEEPAEESPAEATRKPAPAGSEKEGQSKGEEDDMPPLPPVG